MAKLWNTQSNDDQIRQISVNVSPRQFLRGNPDVSFISYLRDIDLSEQAIVIEITEGLLLEDKLEIKNQLKNLHQAGLKIALDDFGTGYSAMAYLKKFNIDYLKIDRSFIRDLETDASDRAIAEAIIVMAHRLGLQVIAEGVETSGQRDLLALTHCDYLQGYFYAKPMPSEQFLIYALSASTRAKTTTSH
jgi:EAL domain-containing protein (putative c-di-GMP-specific phosphodiesterase class I)